VKEGRRSGGFPKKVGRPDLSVVNMRSLGLVMSGGQEERKKMSKSVHDISLGEGGAVESGVTDRVLASS